MTLIKALLWICTFPVSLLFWPMRIFGGGGPCVPRKKLFSRKPDLNTPEKAATFVVMHIGEIEFFQLGEIEKAVNRLPAVILAKRSGKPHAPSRAIYASRLLHPLGRMNDVWKMSDRWSSAWLELHGCPAAWKRLCAFHWTLFLHAQIDRAVASGKLSMTREEALSHFNPSPTSP